MKQNNYEYGILASGNLGRICIEHIYNTTKINFVLTDKLSLSIIDYCENKNIPFFVGKPRCGKGYDFIKDLRVDIIFSINYLFIIEKDIIDHANKYAINFHGSMLPKYRGRTPHVWAIINNEKATGITAHLMTEGCDEGDIVYQESFDISEDDIGATVLVKFNKKFPYIIDIIMNMISSGSVVLQKQDNCKATWFGKRTPEDGRINWDWQREQIRNWVRALSKPYPGAFTFYHDAKIIIHKIEYSDYGFHYQLKNGEILFSGNDIIVKTPNGAIKLVDFESPLNLKFAKGEVLI